MEKVQEFCNEIRKDPEKADALFEELPIKIQRYILSESMGILLFPRKKTSHQRGMAHGVFKMIKYRPKKKNIKTSSWYDYFSIYKGKYKQERSRFRKIISKYAKDYNNLPQDEIILSLPPPKPEQFESVKTPHRVVKIASKDVKAVKSERKRKSPTKSRRRIKYEKEFQRYPSLDSHDPRMLFYLSLYKEKGNSSKLAVKWLTERGALDRAARKQLTNEYESLKKSNKK